MYFETEGVLVFRLFRNKTELDLTSFEKQKKKRVIGKSGHRARYFKETVI